MSLNICLISDIDDILYLQFQSPSVEMVHEVGSHERRETMTQSGAGSDLAQWLPVPQSDASMTSTQTSNTQDYVTKQVCSCTNHFQETLFLDKLYRNSGLPSCYGRHCPGTTRPQKAA